MEDVGAVARGNSRIGSRRAALAQKTSLEYLIELTEHTSRALQ